MVIHRHDCVVCHRDDQLIAISEFGKAVCRRCFPGFIQRRLERLMRRRQMCQHGDSVAVALSGGKDSATLAHTLHSLRHRLRISVVGLHVNMGLGSVSEASQNAVAQLCELLQIKLHISRVADFDISVEPVAQFHQCGVCGAVRRALLNRLCAQLGVHVLATGHTLEDVLQFMLKGILSGRLDAPRPMLLPATHRPRKVKPLYFTPETATEVYAQTLDLPRSDVECSYFDPESHRFKQVFGLLEQLAPMSKIQFAHTMLKAMPPAVPENLERLCDECGEPTNATYCPICRLRHAQ
jgi:tRNA(Ile)-lysidine synthase TilS/MesJ